MTTKEVLNLDCREKKNKEIIQKVLKQIKPLSKYSNEQVIPLEMIEKAITVMCKKYCLRIKELIPDVWGSESNTIWRAIIIDDTNFKTLEVVYGVSLYEVLAKAAIRLYSEVKRGIKVRK